MRSCSACGFCGFFGGLFANAHATAQDFGVRPRGFAAIIFVVGGHGKQGGVDAGERSREIGVFISAEVHVYAHLLFIKFLDLFFDACDIAGGFDNTDSYCLFSCAAKGLRGLQRDGRGRAALPNRRCAARSPAEKLFPNGRKNKRKDEKRKKSDKNQHA